jgi:hypothetical protein
MRLLINSVVTTGVNGTESIEVNSVQDNDGKVYKLSAPIEISVRKSQVYVRYSLVYLADVNSNPYEKAGSTGLLNCLSDSSASSSDGTCGSLLLNGQRVPDSEGFCCPCSLDQMLGFGSHQRGDIQCNIFSGLFGNGASVHCLRWGGVWYSLFRVMTPTIESSIEISSSNNTVLSLNPQSLMGSTRLSSSLNLTARVVGSFNWQRPPTDWGLSYLVAAPNVPGSKPVNDKRFTAWNPSNPFEFGFLLPQSQVDLTGRSCNKIGVSHAAFTKYQANRCYGVIGDCLRGQLEDMWKNSKSSDLLPTQLCQAIGGSFVPDDGYRLSCLLGDSASDIPTQVLIELNAPEVQIVTNVADGVIVNVSSSTDIVALVQKTTVYVTVKNSGLIRSEFLVAVTACDPNSLSLPLNALRVAVDPSSLFDAAIKIEDSNVNASNYTCTAQLLDSEGNTVDTRAFRLDIASANIDRNGQESNSADGGDLSRGVILASDPCTSDCSSFFSLICFIQHGCWSNLGSLLGTLGASAAVLVVLSKLGAWSLIWRGLKKCVGCGNSDSPKPKRRDSDTVYNYPTPTAPPPTFLATGDPHYWYFSRYN